MRTLVVDVAADSGGALIILKQYYEEFLKDQENEYIFVVSVVDLEPKENIQIEKLPWVKKSWLHRLWFDNVYGKKLVKKHKVDKIFSLQNTLLNGVNLPQELYLHQPLPYSVYRFSLSENKKLWVYQNIISRKISKSVKRAQKVIIQTKWMKDSVIKKDKVEESKIEIIAPKYLIKIKNKFSESNFNNLFFYPADDYIYKNHKVILEAIKLLKNEGITNFKVVLTLSEDNLPRNCKELYSEVRDQIILLGKITHEQVMDYYSKSVLIFPSYIETFGLPLLEAKTTESPIIASDTLFSHEILDGYEKAVFIDPFDSIKLKENIKSYFKLK